LCIAADIKIDNINIRESSTGEEDNSAELKSLKMKLLEYEKKLTM